eukprot:2962018-Pleurochrysis_carterae.AAC.2
MSLTVSVLPVPAGPAGAPPRYIPSACERVLVAVVELDVSDGDARHLVVGAPVEPHLLRPLEVAHVAELPLGQLVEDVALVYVHRDERLELLASPRAVRAQIGVWLQIHRDHVVQARHVLAVRRIEDRLLRLGAEDGVLAVERPDEVDPEQTYLRHEQESSAQVFSRAKFPAHTREHAYKAVRVHWGREV